MTVNKRRSSAEKSRQTPGKPVYQRRRGAGQRAYDSEVPQIGLEAGPRERHAEAAATKPMRLGMLILSYPSLLDA